MKDLQNPLFHRKLAWNLIPKVIPDELRASHKSPRRHEDRHHRQHPQQCLRLHLSKPVIAGPETRWPESFLNGNTADVSSFLLHRLCFCFFSDIGEVSSESKLKKWWNMYKCINMWNVFFSCWVQTVQALLFFRNLPDFRVSISWVSSNQKPNIEQARKHNIICSLEFCWSFLFWIIYNI